MKIDLDKYWLLSDLVVRASRELAELGDWRNYSTSFWRMHSNDLLNEILSELKIEIDKELKNK